MEKMTLEQIEARRAEIEERKAAIATETEAEGADLDALETEINGLNDEQRSLDGMETEIREAAEQRQRIIAEVVKTGEVKKEFKEEKRNMENNIEVRNSKEYIDAYAEYVKDPSDEKRALLTEMVGGGVAVPTFVEEIVKTAWEEEKIMARVRKTYLPGIFEQNFEVSADDAHVHTEGGDPVAEEDYVLGIASIPPVSLKKWLGISKQAYSLRGREFLEFVYREIAYKIAHTAAKQLIYNITQLPQTATTTSPSADKVTVAATSLGATAMGIAHLSDEAENACLMINKLTYGTIIDALTGAQYGQDPFRGIPVLFNNQLPAYETATTGQVWGIVGDLGSGAVCNLPNGSDEVEFTFDPYTQKKKNMVEVLGELYAGIGVVQDKAFALLVK